MNGHKKLYFCRFPPLSISFSPPQSTSGYAYTSGHRKNICLRLGTTGLGHCKELFDLQSLNIIEKK